MNASLHTCESQAQQHERPNQIQDLVLCEHPQAWYGMIRALQRPVVAVQATAFQRITGRDLFRQTQNL